MGRVGNEFGATTGRPRRCGWLDLVLLRYAARLNGLTGLVVTKLDVLSGLDPLRVCVSYRYRGQEWDGIPFSPNALAEVEPIYVDPPGWSEVVQEHYQWFNDDGDLNNATAKAAMALSKIEPSSERLMRPAFSVMVSPTAASTIGAAPATTLANNMVRFSSNIDHG